MRSSNRLGSAVLGMALAALPALGMTHAKEVERVQTVPLGGTSSDFSGDKAYGVYVPTRFGGELTIKVSDGTVGEIAGPDGKARQNGHEVGENQQGWYTFKVTGATKPYTIETTFVQEGRSLRKPWNFYYWPTKADSIHEPWAGGNGRVDTQANPNSDDIQVRPFGSYVPPGEDVVRAGPNGLLETRVARGDDSTWFPNLYDDLTFMGADGTLYQTPSPLLKYDQIFGTSARAYESARSQNHDIQRWPGHCLGGAMASINLNEPNPDPRSGLTKDELKALWAELGENHLNHRIGDYATDIPPGPPRPGFDACDRFVPRFHAMLETHIRGQKQNLLGNLRAFPPRGTVNEVWNHGIGHYTATYHAIPGKGERAVKLEVVLEGNTGSSLNGQDNNPRINNYVYTLVYGLDGKVDETNPSTSDWISVGGECLYAPLNLLEVTQSNWAGHNPMVTEANLRSVDLANGGGGRFNGRLASGPPNFRPVGNYEGANRASMFANRSPDSDSASPRRGGLFRTLFGR
ncbi:MAG: hypothetical protein P4L84_10795 [Isosphaeraceae bacterium]|nr:hypothetical protein [Isosphaeraceae bacterium]